MRSALLIVLLFAVAVGQFGATSLLLVRHQRGRRRVEVPGARGWDEEGRAGLTHLVVLAADRTASNPAFVRVGRREVRYQGRLYDVACEELRGDTLHLWGHWDPQEEAALELLARAFEGASYAVGLAAVSAHPKILQLLYLARDAAALRPPSPRRIRYALRRARIVAAPFDEVPHPPPLA